MDLIAPIEVQLNWNVLTVTGETSCISNSGMLPK